MKYWKYRSICLEILLHRNLKIKLLKKMAFNCWDRSIYISINRHVLCALIHCIRVVSMSKYFGDKWCIWIQFFVCIAVDLARQHKWWDLIFSTRRASTFIRRRWHITTHHTRRPNEIWYGCCLPNWLLWTFNSVRCIRCCRSGHSLTQTILPQVTGKQTVTRCGFCVNFANVLFQIEITAKSLEANTARVWFLFVVRVHVEG